MYESDGGMVVGSRSCLSFDDGCTHTRTHVHSFNPSSKVAPGYQDILGDVGDDTVRDACWACVYVHSLVPKDHPHPTFQSYPKQVEAVAGVFNETDMYADDAPDGADEGFGAPEFGEEDHVRVRDGQEQMFGLQEGNYPSIDPILREMEGFGAEDSEAEDDGVDYGTSSGSEGKREGEGGGSVGRGGAGMFGSRSNSGGGGGGGAARRNPAPPSAARGAGGSIVFAEGFAAAERAAGSDMSQSDYDGDDDDSEDDEE